jgi:hypothetical protein
MGYSVHKINCDTKQKTCLYEFIEKITEADLLAQLAMCFKDDNELIYIMPGWNRGINRNPEEYKKALELAEKYRHD